MRILGYLERPPLLITVFKHDNKISVKLEVDLMEQIYKLRDDLYLSELREIDSLLDEEWMQDIINNFESMAASRLKALARYQDKIKGDQEPDII